jgi:hypothetical protein
MANKGRGTAELNALFIGNSFTARNDLPGLIEALASARGKVFHHRLISTGGASLRTHWNAGVAKKAIEDGGYDWVVLQEQSTLPVKNAARMHENVRLFDGMIRSSGARTALYMTWARRGATQSQQAITDAYTTIGEELGASVVPVGLAWESLLREDDGPVLHDRDDSHPTLEGSYLAALVFLAVLFNEDPLGAGGDAPGIEEKDQVRLRKAASKVVKALAKKRGRR